MSLSLAFYSIAAIAVLAETAYGAWLLSLPAPQLKARGYELIYSALESCVTGIFFAIILISSPYVLETLGIRFVDANSAAEEYLLARDRYIRYAVDLALVARDLTLTGVLSPLASTWYAASGLANIFTGYLTALSSALFVASRFCSLLGPPLVSLGVVLAGTSRLRRLGVALAVGVVSLEVVVGAVAPYFVENAESLKFKYAGIPLSGIAQYFAGAVNDVLYDVKLMGEFASWVSISIGIAGTVSAGVSIAAGGLSDTIISKLRV